MSYCQQEGKDGIIFVTKDDHKTPSNVELVHGSMLPNEDINWNCPCLGGMASGPCGEQFKLAFFCFHYSAEDLKGKDCVDEFRKYLDLYPQEDEEEEEEKSAEHIEETAPTEATATKEEVGTS
uniref:Coiled-coil-helix-coiled-coil-helix domain containing 4 n=1 Tax=Gorilla gorilla gorilla TaxID=9595 RepID=A0A2I2YQN4_GORGO